jgi:uncharacterized protein
VKKNLANDFLLYLSSHSIESALKMIASGDIGVQIYDEFGTTPLIDASYYGDYEIVEALCGLGADVNARASTGETPLVNVVRGAAFSEASKPLECASLLLQCGANPNSLVYDGCNALHQAIIHVQVDLVELFLKFGADPRVCIEDGPSKENAFELAESGRPQGQREQLNLMIDLFPVDWFLPQMCA